MSTVLGVVWGSGIETGEIDHRRYPDLELETLGQECERTCVEFVTQVHTPKRTP